MLSKAMSSSFKQSTAAFPRSIFALSNILNTSVSCDAGDAVFLISIGGKLPVSFNQQIDFLHILISIIIYEWSFCRIELPRGKLRCIALGYRNVAESPWSLAVGASVTSSSFIMATSSQLGNLGQLIHSFQTL